MGHRSSSLGLLALLERTGPVLGSEGMGGLCGQHTACLGSLGGEQRGFPVKNGARLLVLHFVEPHHTLRKIN